MGARRRATLWLGVVVVAASAGGCSGSAGADYATLDPSLTQVRRAEDVLAGLTTNAESDRFHLEMAASAEQWIIRCMAGDGFSYKPKDPRNLVDVATDTDYGSRAYARTYGFGVTAAPTFRAADDPNLGSVHGLTSIRRAAYQNRLSSCADRANRSARKSSGADAAGAWYAATDERVRDDPRYLAAEGAWATCAGHIARTRTALIASFQARRAETAAGSPALHRLRNEERKAAVTTFTCSQTLDDVYRRLYQQHRRK